MEESSHIPNLQYRIASYENDPAVFIQRFSLMWEEVESKADFAYGSTIIDTKVEIHYDPNILGQENNVVICFSGPDKTQFDYIASRLESLIGCETKEMSEDQEDDLLPKILVI